MGEKGCSRLPGPVRLPDEPGHALESLYALLRLHPLEASVVAWAGAGEDPGDGALAVGEEDGVVADPDGAVVVEGLGQVGGVRVAVGAELEQLVGGLVAVLAAGDPPLAVGELDKNSRGVLSYNSVAHIDTTCPVAVIVAAAPVAASFLVLL